MDIKEISEKLLKRVDELIVLGNKVLNTRYKEWVAGTGGKLEQFVDKKLFMQWHMSCSNLLKTIPARFGYADRYAKNCHDFTYDSASKGLGVLLAVKDDISSGFFQNVEALISAEVFDDLLEMSEHLLDNGYKNPAASLIGAVLEDGLRRICGNNNVPVKDDDNIGSLNQKLYQKSIYGKPQMRQVIYWQSIRDSADHGKFEEYSAETVKNMFEGVRNFLASQLT